ncbi:50S ribosomal protein L17 [Candidatus Peregrinibacteria bacterium CG_4_10_14_0_2_um_filter_43_11]|nr:MAG: 50S ribosomal protein L17 [Candidatus Peregrinibacteria bacterium CG_4_10_14_0_2_um_filter_43_11]
MRHQVKSTRINRKANHLNAMLRNLATSVILYEKVKTTEAKAKLVRPLVEKMITFAKKKELSTAIRELNQFFLDENATKKVTQELLERYKDRNSGFLRLTHKGFRAGDSARIMQIELI